LKEWEIQFVIISDGDPFLEKELRRMSIYDFNFRILALKTKSDNNSRSLTEPFGFGKD
jgi:hypothetical protein